LNKDGSENEVLFLDSGGLPCTVDENLPMPIRGLRETAYRSLKGVYDNYFADSHWVKYLPKGHMRMENVLFAPLIVEEKAISLIGLANKEGGFTQRDLDFITSMGDIAAVALRNSRNLESVKYLSFHDQLTGLYNRHYFVNELKRLENSRLYPIAIISADMDGLKEINDSKGHAEGDRYLQDCAAVLNKSIRGYDLIARIGGDEFVMVLPETNEKAGEEAISRINNSINQHNEKNNDLPLSISMGVAICEEKGCSLEETYHQADRLMYQNKIKRKNQDT